MSDDHQTPIELAATDSFVRVAESSKGQAEATSAHAIRIAKASEVDNADASKSAGSGHDSGLPALYTSKQAKAGKRVFNNKCVACHGENLQGKSAPSVAGKDFLEVANRNGWTLQDLRNVVVYNMPFNNPGTLSKHQYADVLAYLLAANCYPAGNKPFPKDGSDALGKLHVEPPGSMHPTDKKTGVCSVH
jgi:mono/diheme cytochrome c family protein